MSNSSPKPDFNKIFNTVKRKIVITAEVEGLRFIQGNFDKEGFTDETFEAWKPRNPDIDAGRPILRDTTNLRGSIKAKHNINSMEVEFKTDVEYAQIHNEGGEITVTEKMKRFFWAKLRESGAVSKKQGGDGTSDDVLNAKQLFFKRMALMEVGKKIKIPKRQFIGESKSFMKDLEKEIATIISTEFQNIPQT